MILPCLPWTNKMWYTLVDPACWKDKQHPLSFHSIRSSTVFQWVATRCSPTWYSILSVLSLSSSSSSQQAYGRATVSRTNYNNRQWWWPFASTHPTPAQQQQSSSDDPLPLLVPEESDPTHAHVFALLREAVIREKGGYVHADLGFLSPAPSGPIRGLGMVQDSDHSCRTQCKPGTSAEKRSWIKTKQVRQKCLRKYNPQKCQELLGAELTLASHLNNHWTTTRRNKRPRNCINKKKSCYAFPCRIK